MPLWILQRATTFWTLLNWLPNKFTVQEFDRRKCLWSSLSCLAIFLFCTIGTCIFTDRYAQVQIKKFIKPQSIRKKCKTCYSLIRLFFQTNLYTWFFLHYQSRHIICWMLLFHRNQLKKMPCILQTLTEHLAKLPK